MSLSITTSAPDNSVAIAAATQALAAANNAVATDQRNHSPNCVAVDEKTVAKDEIALAQAKSAQPQNAQSASTGGLDISV